MPIISVTVALLALKVSEPNLVLKTQTDDSVNVRVSVPRSMRNGLDVKPGDRLTVTGELQCLSHGRGRRNACLRIVASGLTHC